MITLGSITDDQGTHAFDSGGTTGRISWTTPNGYNGFDDTPTTITTQYFYTFSCADVAGVHKVILGVNFWTIDVNGDGSVWLYDVPDVPGEEDGSGQYAVPTSCDPLTSSHSFTFRLPLPSDTATVSIPKADDMTCSPCCFPGPGRSLSVTASGGVAHNGTYSLTFIDEGTIPPARFIWAVGIPTSLLTAWNISFYCNGGFLFVNLYTSGTVDDTTCVMSAIVDFSCNPLHIHFRSGDPRCFFTDIVIDEA